jgi:ribonucleotide monophosphatase NagD (HAD superfamily)
MTDMGFANPKLENIYGSSYICANFMKTTYPEIKKIFLIGVKELREEFEDAQIQVLGGDNEYSPPVPEGKPAQRDFEKFKNCEVDSDVGAVIVGHDIAFNYNKLATASLFL